MTPIHKVGHLHTAEPLADVPSPETTTRPGAHKPAHQTRHRDSSPLPSPRPAPKGGGPQPRGGSLEQLRLLARDAACDTWKGVKRTASGIATELRDDVLAAVGRATDKTADAVDLQVDRAATRTKDAVDRAGRKTRHHVRHALGKLQSSLKQPQKTTPKKG